MIAAQGIQMFPITQNSAYVSPNPHETDAIKAQHKPNSEHIGDCPMTGPKTTPARQKRRTVTMQYFQNPVSHQIAKTVNRLNTHPPIKANCTKLDTAIGNLLASYPCCEMNCSTLCDGKKPCNLPKTMKQNAQYIKVAHKTPTDLTRVSLLNRAIPVDKISKEVLKNNVPAIYTTN